MTDAQRAALNASRNAQCTSDISYPGDLEVWKPIHGTCVRYRQLQQSCIEDPLTYTNPAFDSPFFRAPDGKVREERGRGLAGAGLGLGPAGGPFGALRRGAAPRGDAGLGGVPTSSPSPWSCTLAY